MRRAEQEDLLKKMQDKNNALMARLKSTESQVQFNNNLLQEVMKRMNFQLPEFQLLARATNQREEEHDEEEEGDDED